MATIIMRNGKWQARVRRKGFATQTKTFSQKTDALKWARHVEVKIETHELPQAGVANRSAMMVSMRVIILA
jgi:hypothetical protein